MLARLVPSADRGLVFGTLAFGTDTCNIITFTYTYYRSNYYPLLSEGEKNVRDGVRDHGFGLWTRVYRF